MSTPATPVPAFCQFCPHPKHDGQRCTQCRCKGKPKWWQRVLSGVGEKLGQAKFGGDG